MKIPEHLQKPLYKLTLVQLDELKRLAHTAEAVELFDEATAECERREYMSAQTDMIPRWAENLDERRVLAEFLEWLSSVESGMCCGDLQHDQLLDGYHGIDQHQLDNERRALLESCGKLNEANKQ